MSYSCDGSTGAGITGALKSVLGVVGASEMPGLDDSVASDALDKAKSDLTTTQTYYNNLISSAKLKNLEDQTSYLQDLMNFSNLQNSVVTTTIEQKQAKDELLIYMLIVLVIFLILFDIL